jgi:hypothetical protein
MPSTDSAWKHAPSELGQAIEIIVGGVADWKVIDLVSARATPVTVTVAVPITM